jgi:hypothetical protein
MDTDDLTQMAYRTIILAGEFCDSIRCEIGAMSTKFSNEDAYLRGILRFLRDIVADPEEYLEEWGLDGEVEPAWYRNKVRVVIDHVTKTLATSEDQRGPRPFD